MSVGPVEPSDIGGLIPGGTDGDVAKLVATVEPSRVVWSNAAAARLFGTGDAALLTRLIFGRPAQARPRLIRLSRLEPQGPVHLERILVSSRFRSFGVTLACAVVPGRPGRTVLMQEVAPARMPVDPVVHAEPPALRPAPAYGSASRGGEGEDLPPSSVLPRASLAPPLATTHASPVMPATNAEPERRTGTRFVWRTDHSGTVTFVSGEMGVRLGASALQVGEDLQARLRALPSGSGVAVADLFAARRSWPGSTLAWTGEEAGAAVSVVLGGTPAPGNQGYRGFGLIVDADPPRAAPEDAEPEPAAAPLSPALEPEMPPVSPPSNAASGEPDGPVAANPGDGPVEPDQQPEQRDPSNTAPSVEAPRAAASVVAPPSNQNELAPRLRDVAITTGGRVMPFPGLAAAANSKVVHLASFKAGVPAFSGTATTRRDPPRPVEPQPQPVPEKLDVPQWAETPKASAAPEPRLSSHERFNFDEIARALAVLPGADAAGSAKPATPADPLPPPPLRVERDGKAAGDAWTLLDALPLGIVVSRAEAVVYANWSVLDLLGYGRLEELTEAGGLASLFGSPGAGLPDAGTGSHRLALVARGGTTVEVDVRVQTITWLAEPACLLSIRRSGDDDARARLAAIGLDLRRSQELATDLAEALDVAASGAGFLDPRGRVLSLNGGAERMFGYDQREIVGDSCSILFGADQQTEWREFFGGFVAAAGRTSAFRRFSGRKRTGAAIPVGVSLRRVSADKVCIVWQEGLQDHAAQGGLDMLRREAERTTALKSEFLAKVSHEIRTPLNAILGFTEIIIEERFGAIGNDRYREYLKDIHASGTHVVSLINDLLDLSRIEAGGDETQLVSVDVNTALGECVAALQGQAHRDRIIIRTSFAARSPSALVDARAFRQIALNLLSNAVKFNEPGGQVIASTAVSESGQVVMRIRDTGPGMSDSDIETAMKPYRQLATPKSSGGSGLGLPLTKAMIEASHGGLRIKSTPGQGTLVEVTFRPAPEAALALPAE